MTKHIFIASLTIACFAAAAPAQTIDAAAVYQKNCATCHDPHGSSNERMLVAKQPLLCQRCHIGTRHPSSVYDAATVGAGANPSVRVYSRGCVQCHSAIHGSNHPSGQRFIR